MLANLGSAHRQQRYLHEALTSASAALDLADGKPADAAAALAAAAEISGRVRAGESELARAIVALRAALAPARD